MKPHSTFSWSCTFFCLFNVSNLKLKTCLLAKLGFGKHPASKYELTADTVSDFPCLIVKPILSAFCSIKLRLRPNVWAPELGLFRLSTIRMQMLARFSPRQSISAGLVFYVFHCPPQAFSFQNQDRHKILEAVPFFTCC